MTKSKYLAMYVMANKIWDFPEIPNVERETYKNIVKNHSKGYATPVYLHKTVSSIFLAAELLLQVNVISHQLIGKYSFCFGFALSAIEFEIENAPILDIFHFVSLLKMQRRGILMTTQQFFASFLYDSTNTSFDRFNSQNVK